MQQLLDVVHKVLLELQSRPLDAFLECFDAFLHHFDCFLDLSDLVLVP